MNAPTIRTAPRPTRRRRRKASRAWHILNWSTWVLVNVASFAALIHFHRTGLIADVAEAVRQSLGGF